MSTNVAHGVTTIPASGSQPIQLTGPAVGAAVEILAMPANIGAVYLGNSEVTSADGFPLIPGAATGLDINDPSRIFLAGTAGDKVRWLAVRP